jgi:hypothetical protein
MGSGMVRRIRLGWGGVQTARTETVGACAAGPGAISMAHGRSRIARTVRHGLRSAFIRGWAWALSW